MTEPYEVIQDGDEMILFVNIRGELNKVDMILKKDTFTGKNAQSVDSRRLICYVSEEEFLKNDPDYNEPAKDTNTTETDDSVDNNAENNVITTENNN